MSESTVMRSIAPAHLPRQLFDVSVVSLVAMFALLLARRLVGGLETPLQTVPALLAGLAISATGYLLRMRFPLLQSTRGGYTIKLAIALLLVALSLPGTTIFALFALWLPSVLSESYQTYVSHSPLHPLADDSDLAADEPPLSPDVVQQFTRVRSESGETISGVVRVEFLPLEQTSIAHIAFCPPLARDPIIALNVLDGDASIKLGEARTYGMRLEAKRSGPLCEAAEILVEFEAT